uniref:Transmembrane protein 200B n=1 Tax=Nothoprocta perdicaria TaxID=30464 RepID=A0A8C6ZM60_NOTPE
RAAGRPRGAGHTTAPSRRRRRRRRRKSPPEVTVKGQLRMRSPSGVFVMVGISVVLVGMTIAVVGYWPHRAGASSGNASSPGDVRKEVAHARHFPHSEKLKLIGPVIMGIGLFIFICANTMLYENRDMETRLLMQKAWRAATRWTSPPGSSTRAPAANGLSATEPSGSRPQPSSSTTMARRLLPPSSESPAKPIAEVRRPSWALLSHSSGTSPGGQEHQDNHVKELSSDPQLHNPGHSKSLDLGRPAVLLVAPIKDRKNRSWPRLDHLSLVAYAKLGSTGESSDLLLEQRGRQEARPGSWEVGKERGSQV